MQTSGSIDRILRTRSAQTAEFTGSADYLIESDPGPRPAPQAFLVHQQANWVLPTHFHFEEQFQVVFGGGGTLGRHEVQPLYIHYASREAGYGPLVSGPQGLDYLTLRSVTDSGAWYLPAQRARMHAGLRKRQESAGPVPVASQAERDARNTSSMDVLVAPDATGIGVWMLRIAPGGTLRAPDHPNGGGRFHVVAAGEWVRDEVLRPSSCVYTSPDEGSLALQAGPHGLDVVVLQFPVSALAPQGGGAAGIGG